MARRIVHKLGSGKKILLAAVAAGAVAGPLAFGMLHLPASRTQSEVLTGSAKFEVASIKPTDPSFSGTKVQILPNDNMVDIRGLTLKGLIELAYNPGFGLLHPSLVTGGPKWYDRDRYDVLAKSEGPGIPSQEERKQMLRSLLTERFRLTFHRKSKEITAFALVVGKKGPRMKEGKPDANGAPSIVLRGLSMTGRNASMPELAATLQPMMPLVDPAHADFPVVDRTGLTGRFDFDLKFALEQTKAEVDTALNPDIPDLFTAIQEQLGLKLSLMKTPVEALVVDHAELPSPN